MLFVVPLKKLLAEGAAVDAAEEVRRVWVLHGSELALGWTEIASSADSHPSIQSGLAANLWGRVERVNQQDYVALWPWC